MRLASRTVARRNKARSKYAEFKALKPYTDLIRKGLQGVNSIVVLIPPIKVKAIIC